MPSEVQFSLCVAIAVIAFLYSSVGHAGASGYIAVMSLGGLHPNIIRPTALALNVLVAIVTTCQFVSRGHFSFRLFWPFAVTAVPMAFVGGRLDVPVTVFRAVVGVVLLVSAFRFLMRPGTDEVASPPSLSVALPAGAAVGLLSGITGTGGGIFLTPLMLWMKWAGTRTAAGVSSLLILLNSVAGLLGSLSRSRDFPEVAIPMAAAALIGGTAGSYLGSQRLRTSVVRRLLAGVLVIAAAKLLLTD